MVTRAQPGLDHDTEIFRTLARHHQGLLGLWSNVLEGGCLTIEDPAQVAAG